MIATEHTHKILTKDDCIITATSNEHQDTDIHLPLDCLFRSMFRLTSQETSKLLITGPLWRESTDDQCIPHHKDPVMRKVFSFYDNIKTKGIALCLPPG